MAERNVRASHRLGPIFVTLAGDRAIAQLVVIVDIPFKLEGVEVMLSNYTRLLLRAERREGVSRLFGFDPVYLRDEIAPVIPGQTVAIDPGALKAFRPSYRFLSYCFASVGTRRARSRRPGGSPEARRPALAPAHVSGELSKMMTGVSLVHVPYRGAGPALVDLLSGLRQSPNVPLPADAMLILPELVLAYAMNSGTVLVGTNGLTTMTWGSRLMPATGAMSRMKLKLSLSVCGLVSG